MRFSMKSNEKLNKIQDENLAFKSCSRFQPYSFNHSQDKESANNFIALRKNGSKTIFIQYLGCQKRSALRFCLQPHCKVDLTQKKHGPSQARILKAKPDPATLYYGWQIAGKVDYDSNLLEKEYKRENNENLNKIFNTESEFNQKMKYLKKFYEELEKKYNLNELTNDEILQKLYELANEKSGEYDYFMKGQGNRFFELAQIIREQQDIKEKSILFELEAFESIIPNKLKNEYKMKNRTSRSPKNQEYDSERQLIVERRSTILGELGSRFKNQQNISQRMNGQMYQMIKEEYNKTMYGQSEEKSNSLKKKIQKIRFITPLIRPFMKKQQEKEAEEQKMKSKTNRLSMVRATQLFQQQQFKEYEEQPSKYFQFEKNLEYYTQRELEKILRPINQQQISGRKGSINMTEETTEDEFQKSLTNLKFKFNLSSKKFYQKISPLDDSLLQKKRNVWIGK